MKEYKSYWADKWDDFKSFLLENTNEIGWIIKGAFLLVVFPMIGAIIFGSIFPEGFGEKPLTWISASFLAFMVIFVVDLTILVLYVDWIDWKEQRERRIEKKNFEEKK